MKPWEDKWLNMHFDNPYALYKVAQVDEEDGDKDADEDYAFSAQLAEIRLLPATNHPTDDVLPLLPRWQREPRA